jgi:hypothetical protein
MLIVNRLEVNTTFNSISDTVLLVEKTGVPYEENVRR